MRRSLRAAAVLTCVTCSLAAVGAGTPAEARGTSTAARLGIYYFGGWSGSLSNFHFGGLLYGPYTSRQPLYGWLDGADAMRTQLYWARRIGADFFNFLWYYRPETTPDPFLNRALANYLALRDHHGVGFAITYTNESAFVVPRDRWRAVADEWVTKYFTRPEYARIAGKPVLFVLEGSDFFEQVGGSDAGVNAALEELREVAREHGLPGVFVVGARYTPYNFDYDYFPEPFRGESLDAVSQYGYPALAGESDGERPTQSSPAPVARCGIASPSAPCSLTFRSSPRGGTHGPGRSRSTATCSGSDARPARSGSSLPMQSAGPAGIRRCASMPARRW